MKALRNRDKPKIPQDAIIYFCIYTAIMLILTPSISQTISELGITEVVIGVGFMALIVFAPIKLIMVLKDRLKGKKKSE